MATLPNAAKILGCCCRDCLNAGYSVFMMGQATVGGFPPLPDWGFGAPWQFGGLGPIPTGEYFGVYLNAEVVYVSNINTLNGILTITDSIVFEYHPLMGDLIHIHVISSATDGTSFESDWRLNDDGTITSVNGGQRIEAPAIIPFVDSSSGGVDLDDYTFSHIRFSWEPWFFEGQGIRDYYDVTLSGFKSFKDALTDATILCDEVDIVQGGPLATAPIYITDDLPPTYMTTTLTSGFGSGSSREDAREFVATKFYSRSPDGIKAILQNRLGALLGNVSSAGSEVMNFVTIAANSAPGSSAYTTVAVVSKTKFALRQQTTLCTRKLQGVIAHFPESPNPNDPPIFKPFNELKVTIYPTPAFGNFRAEDVLWGFKLVSCEPDNSGIIGTVESDQDPCSTDVTVPPDFRCHGSIYYHKYLEAPAFGFVEYHGETCGVCADICALPV